MNTETHRENRSSSHWVVLVSALTFGAGLLVGSQGNKPDRLQPMPIPSYMTERISIHSLVPDKIHYVHQVIPFAVSEDNVTTYLSGYPDKDQTTWIVMLDNERIKLYCKPVAVTEQQP